MIRSHTYCAMTAVRKPELYPAGQSGPAGPATVHAGPVDTPPDDLVRAVTARGADDPCPAYVTFSGPQFTQHVVDCVSSYGHGDRDPEPVHVGRIAATDRFGAPVTANVSWSGR